MRYSILKKHLSWPITFRRRQRQINYGLIIVVILGTFISWWLTEYSIYQISEMDLETISWTREVRLSVKAQTTTLQPADPNANADVRAFLNWLNHTNNKILFTHEVGNSPNTCESIWNSHIGDIYTDCGVYPSGVGVEWTDSNFQGSICDSNLMDYCNAGGLVQVGIHFNTPYEPDSAPCANDVTGTGQQSPAGDPSLLFVANFQDEGASCVDDNYWGEVDQVAAFLQDFEDAGCVVLFAPFDEMDLGGLWWWAQGASGSINPAYGRRLKQELWECLTGDGAADCGGGSGKGLHNLVFLDWPRGAQGPTNLHTNWQDWYTIYPGNAYVDILAFGAGKPDLNSYDENSQWDVLDSADWGPKIGNEYPQTTGYPSQVYDDSNGSPMTQGTCGSLSRNEWCYDLNNGIANRKLWVRMHDDASPGNDVKMKTYYDWRVDYEECDIGGLNKILGINNYYIDYIKDLNDNFIDAQTFPLAKIVNFWAGVGKFRSKLDYGSCGVGSEGEKFTQSDNVIIRDELVPNPPSLDSPTNNAINIPITPTLHSGTFYGPRAHYASEWQADLNSGDFSSPVYDSGQTSSNLTQNTISQSLNNNTTYKWRVRYAINVNGSAKWGNWSSPATFTTASGAVSDTTRPIVSAFDVQPRTTSGSITASYTVSDNTALTRVELWRANYNSTDCNDNDKANCIWSEVDNQSVSGTTVSGNLTDTPPTGTFYYGLHAVDQAGNEGYEPASPGPIRIVKTFGPVAHWTLDTADISGNIAYDRIGGYNGTISGAFLTSNGRINQALSFDGIDDRVFTSYQPSAGDITFSYWVKFNDFIGAQRSGCNDQNNHRLYLGLTNNDYLHAGLGNRSHTSSVQVPQDTNAWYHLAVTGDGSTGKIYVNGQLQDSFTYSFNGQSNDGLAFGIDSHYNGAINGIVDDVRVYELVLSDQEIANLYNQGLSQDATVPVVSAFDVQPRTTSGSITASYTVSDNTALTRVELWRANYNSTDCNDNDKANCIWSEVDNQSVSGTTVSGNLTDTPPTGTFYYGLHAVDQAGNEGYEPASPGPIRIVKTASANCGDGTCNGTETNATCPADCPASQLYMPADMNANANAQALLNYLDYISDNRLGILPIQWVHNIDSASEWCKNDGCFYKSRVMDLATNNGDKWPAGIGGNLYGSTNYNDQGPIIEEYWNDGGLGIFHGMWGPTSVFDADCSEPFTVKPNDNCLASNSGTGSCSDDFNNVGITNMINDDGRTPYDRWQSYKEDIGDAYEDAESRGYIAFARPFREMNARWFWFSEDNCSPNTAMNPTDFKAMWIDFFEYITGEVSDCVNRGNPYSCCNGPGQGTCRGIHNIIWVYGPTHYWGPGEDNEPFQPNRGSWWDWYPGDSYVDIIAPSTYKGQMYGANHTGVDSDWSRVDDSANAAVFTSAGSGRYQAHTGKLGYFRTGGENALCVGSGNPYSCCSGPGSGSCSPVLWTEVTSSCPEDVDAPREWCWDWVDKTVGGRIYTYGDPSSDYPEGRYRFYPGTMVQEFRSMDKILAFGETSADALINDWLNAWSTTYSDYIYGLFWGSGLNEANTTQQYEFLNHPSVITRDELIPIAPEIILPPNNASNVPINPTLQAGTFYGPRAHYASQWQIDLSTGDFSSPVYDSGQTSSNLTQNTISQTLNNNTTYKWRVRYAINVNGSAKWGSWSNNSIFTTSPGSTCGDGACNGTETSATCPADCPPSSAPCHRLTPTSPIPVGYGSPYNLAQNRPSERLIRTTCNNTTVNLDVGNGDIGQYIFHEAHLYTGSGWQLINLSGPSSSFSGWLNGSANATNIPVANMSATNYIIFYLCYWNGIDWKCGCRDTQCTQRHWNLQTFSQ